jgi:inner membrane protein
MTAPNHLTGGIVFTGLFCSFFSINIFSSPFFIGFTLFGSLLPDIDHTKSWIGKFFYPIAKYISVNYGHRTITHSIFFLIGIVVFSIFMERNFSDNYSISVILFFSVLSHFIFDMVTLQGIPLFYPFYKNPCVLPANPEMRIRSGNIRQEGIILFIFCFLSFFMQDLFANGFWSTINNNFNDVKHQIKEYKKSPNVLNIEYDYNIYQTKFKGKGKYIQASDDEIFILTNNSILSLKKDTPGLKVTTLKTNKTNQKLIQSKIELNNYTEEDLNKLLKDKFISQGTIYASFETSTSDNPIDFKKKFEIVNKYDLSFISHILDTIISNKQKKISELELKLKSEENSLINDNKIYYITLGQLQQEKNKLNLNTDDYETNEIKKNIIEMENKISNYHLKTNLMIEEYKKQLAIIKNSESKKTLYLGDITLIDVSKN